MPDHATEVARLRAELEAVRTERDALKALVEHAPVLAGLTLGPDHELTYANAALRARLRGTDLLGKGLRDALPEMADQSLHEILDTVFGSGEPRRIDGWALPATGDAPAPVVDLLHVPLRDAHGHVTGVASLAVDVTERLALARQVEFLLGELRLQDEALNRAHEEMEDELARRL